MLDLPRFLQLPRIERLYDFLERDAEEQAEIERRLRQSQASGEEFKPEYCNFEDFLNHSDLPPYSDTMVKYHVKEKFRDFHNHQGEVINEILGREGKHVKSEYLSETRAKNIEVEHSAIDFSVVIIGEKVRSVLEQGFHPVNFNDQNLANLFYIEDAEFLNFYDLEVTRKVVDF